MPGPGTYWHTLRYLKPIQLYRRVWFRVARPRPDLRPAPEIRPVARDRWAAPAARTPRFHPPDRFTFLNCSLALSDHGWDDPTVDKLWRYNLHYFDDLAATRDAAGIAAQEAIVARWISENPPGRGTAWEPYPTSLRIVNWIKWIRGGGVPTPEMVRSLAIQARWLEQRLEWHLLGNHLFANAKALVFAGAFFTGDEAERWLSRGMSILDREIPEQILADGGQFELSPMYQAIAVEDMLDLLNIARAGSGSLPPEVIESVEGWVAIISRMRRWLRVMTHPDGQIALFNDAAIGIAPTSSSLEEYAARLGLPEISPTDEVTVLRESGYVRLESPTAVAFIDVAAVGPDYLPGHAHADTLSFELSVFGLRAFVNGGTSVYGTGTERQRQRGTAAHTTVVVDGADSSEVWGGFRVARRAKPVGLAVTRGNPVRIRCAHDGYTRLAGRPVHTREWRFAESMLEIHDKVSGGFSRASARFHLHPDVVIGDLAGPVEARTIELRLSGGQAVRVHVHRGTPRVEHDTWHPEFGPGRPAACLVVDFDGAESIVQISW